jgi:alginate O-acetyltransferase complex protein AlgI
MLFNSFAFLIFLAVTFIIYYLPIYLIRKNQVAFLVLASFFFYSFQKPLLLFLLVFSILINTLFSYNIHKTGQKRTKSMLLLGVIFNLGILAFFKYGHLIAATIGNEFNVKNGILDFILTIPLPIGISFYTFEGISLLLDLYRGKVIPKDDTHSFFDHLRKTAFFISFFPHLIAGPILKARDFYPQIGYKKFTDIQWENGIKKLVLGFYLKMVIADNLNAITANIKFPYFQGFSSGNLVLLTLGYSMQIFADFAGYSLIAIGLGVLFGYVLPKNFDFPYIASSFSEFWRRWHISLSTWLRDYLYISLGGNRKGEIRTYINLFITMLLGGLWHGASWSYATWGAMHGFFLMLERLVFKDKLKERGRNIIGITCVFTVVTVLWLLFKLTDFSYFLLFFKAIYQNTHIHFKLGIDELSILFYALPVILYHVAYLAKDTAFFKGKYNKAELLLFGCMFFFIMVDSGPQGAFIYFQF